MKKQTIKLSVLATALTLATGITAFAAGWEQDGKGWYYVQDNGSRIYAKEFTDPADGSKYYMDPDGYMMTETRVGGFWYGADGRRRDKTEAEIAAEEARKQRIASRPSPAKQQAAAELAAKAAKTTNIAASTTRVSYQAEMKALMDVFFIDARKQLTDNSIVNRVTDNNLEVSYGFEARDRGMVITSSLWKMSNPENSNYKPYALELSYNRNVLSDPDQATVLNETFNKLLKAALGENASTEVYNRCMAEEIGSDARYEQNGSTDTGNSYEITYRNSTIELKIICSEIEPSTEEAGEGEGEAQEEAAAPEQEAAPTTSVIVAGQSALEAVSGTSSDESQATEAAGDNTSADAAGESAESAENTENAAAE